MTHLRCTCWSQIRFVDRADVWNLSVNVIFTNSWENKLKWSGGQRVNFSLIGHFQDDVLETVKEEQLPLQQLRLNHDVFTCWCAAAVCRSAANTQQVTLTGIIICAKLIDNRPIGIMSGWTQITDRHLRCAGPQVITLHPYTGRLVKLALLHLHLRQLTNQSPGCCSWSAGCWLLRPRAH